MEERRRVLIERYLSGLMTPSERKEFQKQIKQNPSLARQLAEHKKLISTGKLTTPMRSKNGLPGQRKPGSSSYNNLNFTNKRIWIYAAVILLAIGIVWWLYYAFRKPAEESIPNPSGNTPSEIPKATGVNENNSANENAAQQNPNAVKPTKTKTIHIA